MSFMSSLTGLIAGSFSYIDKKGRKWYLHSKDSPSGLKLYYFSSSQNEAIGMPDGFIVIESVKTGLPLLKKTARG